MKKPIRKAIILMILSFVCLHFSNFRATAAPESVLYFEPSNESVAVNSNFTLNAMINPGTNKITAVELRISFDKNKLKLNSVDIANSPFQSVLQSAKIDNENGSASIVLGVPPSDPANPVTSISKVAGFNFQALSAVESTIVSITSGSLASALGESGNVITKTIPSNIKIVSNDVNHLPTGSLDHADANQVVGWAYDKNAGSDPILVHIYVNEAFRASEQASVYREDLVGLLGSPNHGYNYTFNEPLFEGTYKIEVYAINQPVGDNPKIGEKIITVAPVCGDGVCNGNENYTTCPADCPPPPDTTAPVISNVVVSGITYNSAIISWDTDEPATSQVEYGLTGQYGQVSGANTTPSQKHSIALAGLSSDATYYFRAKSLDAAGNTGYSASRTFTTAGAPDTTPPSAIQDLETSNTTQTSIDLSWTAPGNDGNIGTAAYYDIRYSSAQITESNWANAHKLTGEPVPGTAGTKEQYAAVGLAHSSTYYFAIKTGDQANNISALSNVVSATTQTPTLSVSLAATEESSYAPLKDVDLTASVSGTATGNINYIFYCNRSDDGTNITTPYDAKFDNLSATTKTADNLCNYDTPGTYSAKVIVQRSGLSAQNRAIITVSEAPDTTAPVISNISVSEIKHNSVKIGWITDEPATGQVEYGASTISYGNATDINSNLTTTHSFDLLNLLPDTVYNYRVKSQDAIGNPAVSENRTFKTAPAPDTTAPAAVSDLLASDIGENSLKLSWTAPGDNGNVGTADSYDVRYSTSIISESNWSSATQASSEPLPAIAGTAQEMTIAGLKADTAYYFALKTADKAGNISALSNIANAKTKPSTQIDTTAPVISNISADTTYSKSAIITWNTNEPADSKVVWGLKSNNLDQTAYNSELKQSHQIVLVDLGRKTTYYYKVISKDAAGNESQSSILSFTTNARNNAPDPVLYLMASNGSVILSWKNPDYEFAKKIVIARDTGKYPSKNDKSSVIAEIKNLRQEKFTDKNVTTGVTYYYSVFVVDDLGNYSEPANVSFQPLSLKEDKRQMSGGGYSDNPSRGKVRNAQIFTFENGALIKWNNPTDSDYVRTIVIRKEGEAPKSVNDGETIYEGNGNEYTDLGLELGKKYGYSIFTYDRRPNFSEAVKLSATIQNKTSYIQKSVKNTDYKVFGMIDNLSSVQSEKVDQVSMSEGGRVAAHGSFVNMAKSGAEYYDRVVAQTPGTISQNQKYSLAYFIQNGTPTTARLGAGERAGVASSYVKTYGRLPQSENEWQDVIKIANGRWPGQKNIQAEAAAKKEFKTIYKREGKNTADDNAVIAIMAYGLRPSERNTRSEAMAINTFKSIFGKAPTVATDWDKVRAIAYSGAKR
jgi:hypothetical protein